MEITLGTALALLGGVVLLVLAFQGWMATRRAQPRRAAESVLPGDRVEPALDGAAPAPPAEAGAAETQPGDDGDAPIPLPTPAPRRVARLDALIDAIVPLALEVPITGELALQHLPASRRAGGKPFYVEGLDAETGEWTGLAPGHRYSELQAGVQLANRSGALNEIEYSEFVQKVQGFAEAVGARPDAPDMLDVVARARELDGLANPLDAQLTVTLRANGVAWSVAYVQQVASRLGFVPGVLPGRLVLAAAEEGAPPMLVLAVDSQAALAAADDATPQSSAVRECTLMLDVPQTPASAEPFPVFHHAARQLVDDLDATAVDNNGEPITLHAYAAIGQELQGLYAQLEQLGLAAGSAPARRVFS